MNDSVRSAVCRLGLALGLAAYAPWAGAGVPEGPSRAVPNFNLLDLSGKNHELRRAEGRAVVLFFTGNGCPIARKSIKALKSLRDHFGPDINFWVVNTYAGDNLDGCEKEYREFHMHPLTYLRDPKQGVALALRVDRTAEVVGISTKDWRVFYRGAIDDRFSEGTERTEVHSRFLETALKEFLAEKPISAPSTQAHGCRITFSKVGDNEDKISYARDVAPLLRSSCVGCHQEGGVGPWSMDGYASVKNYSRMIEEVLLAGQMPPWHADGSIGQWQNDRSLNADQTQTLLNWVLSGSPRGEGPDPLAETLPSIPEWPLGQPSFVVKLPRPEEIPANGILEYRHIAVDLPVTNELWLAGLDVKPGNRRVVHHVIVRAKWNGGPDDGSGNGVMLAGWAPGTANERFPAGTGKHVPAGAQLDLEMHYTTTGSPQTDQTQIAFYQLDEKPEREVTTRAAVQMDLSISPGTDESRDAAVYGFKQAATLYALTPHMHLRGKWMQFDLLLPSGKREVLLRVPRYDFNWQTIYRLAKPRHVPAGAWLLVTGSFDNSAANPSNPEAKKRVNFGLQSWDEMFIGFLEAADDPPPTAKVSLRSETRSTPRASQEFIGLTETAPR